MSFFNYQQAAQAAQPTDKQTGEKIPERILFDVVTMSFEGKDLVKTIVDNPSINEGKTDIGIAKYNTWQPLNYNPRTGEIIK